MRGQDSLPKKNRKQFPHLHEAPERHRREHQNRFPHQNDAPGRRRRERQNRFPHLNDLPNAQTEYTRVHEVLRRPAKMPRRRIGRSTKYCAGQPECLDEESGGPRSAAPASQNDRGEKIEPGKTARGPRSTARANRNGEGPEGSGGPRSAAQASQNGGAEMGRIRPR